jgi:hypothetical protein
MGTGLPCVLYLVFQLFYGRRGGVNVFNVLTQGTHGNILPLYYFASLVHEDSEGCCERVNVFTLAD